MFSYLSPETRVRKEHPLRAIRAMVDSALGEMSPLFDDMYSELGRPSIAPEKLLRAQLLQMLYSVRSERLLMEEIDYSVLFRWFVGMNMASRAQSKGAPTPNTCHQTAATSRPAHYPPSPGSPAAGAPFALAFPVTNS